MATHISQRAAGGTAAPAANGLVEILTWSAQCPDWQRDALRRLCAGPDLEDTDQVELLEIMKGTLQPDLLTGTHIRQTTSSTRAVTLESIRDVENVNALAPGQRLSFCKKGLTAVYGENGSGKSGYVRILKSACKARLERSFDILGDIYSHAPDVRQTATINYLEGGASCTTPWSKGTTGDRVLSAISVFDANAGNIHVSGPNDIAYTPFPLLVLGRLAKTADALKTKLTAEIRQLEGRVPPTVTDHQCSPQTAAGKLMHSLGGETKAGDVEALCAFSDVEKAEFATLKKDLADDPAVTASRCTRLAGRFESLGASLSGIAAALTGDAIEKIQALKRDVAHKTEALRLDAKIRFAGDPLPVGSPAWQALWEAARLYAEREVHSGQVFPVTYESGSCVLCQRPLDVESAARLRRFEAFIADVLGKQLKVAEQAFAAALNIPGADYLKARKIAEIREFLVGSIADQTLAQSIPEFLVRAAWRHRWVCRARLDQHGLEAPDLAGAPLAEIMAAAESLRAKARVLQGAATSPERQQLKSRLDEFTDREWLGVVKDDVLKAIATRREIATLNGLSAQTKTAKITAKSTELAKVLVTDRLRDRFAKEVSELAISRLRVELRQEQSTAGQPKFRICFIAKPSQPVGAVLSEGELRCLALAAFLAELETADGTSGIVLDDPICSLDHIHRGKVAERLAREALHRQVIVFTHDVPFLSQLQQACKEAKAELLTRMISRGGNGPGFCHDEAPPTHRPVAEAIKSLRADLANKRRFFDIGDPTWTDCVTGFGGTLRKLWERAVEEVISPVLIRWTHNINTGGFLQLTVLTSQDHETMREGYGHCSIWEHYQPAAGNAPQPTADDITAGVNSLETWFMGIKARQKELSKR